MHTQLVMLLLLCVCWSLYYAVASQQTQVLLVQGDAHSLLLQQLPADIPGKQ